MTLGGEGIKAKGGILVKLCVRYEVSSPKCNQITKVHLSTLIPRQPFRTDPPEQTNLSPAADPPTFPREMRVYGWEGRAGCQRSPGAPRARPAWSGPCRPRVAAAGHARAPGGRGAALPTWTSSSGGSRGPAAGGGCGGAGCACGWWCGCFSSSPGKSAASRAGFAAPRTGLSCANTGSSCGAGGWGTGPRRALMVNTRVAMDTRGRLRARVAGRARFPPRPRRLGPASSARGRGWRRGRLRADPSANSRRGFRRRTPKAKLFRSATRKRQRPPGGHFLPPRPTSLLHSPGPLPPAPVSARRLRARVPAPRLPTLDASLYFTQLWVGGAPSQTGSAAANPEALRPAGPGDLAYEMRGFRPGPRLRRADRTPLGPRASRAGRPRSLYTTSLTDWAVGAGGGGKGRSGWNLGREGIRVETWREIS